MVRRVRHRPFEQCRRDVDDDARGYKLRHGVACEVTHLNGDIGSDLDATLLAALNGDSRIGDRLADTSGFHETERLRDLENVRRDHIIVDPFKKLIRAEEEASLLLRPAAARRSSGASAGTGCTAPGIAEDDVPVKAHLARLAEVHLEEHGVDFDFARLAGCGDICHDARFRLADTLLPSGKTRRSGLCHHEELLRLTVAELVDLQHELERIDEVETGNADADGVPSVFRIDDLLTRYTLEDRVQEFDELIERCRRQEGDELIGRNVAA